MQGLNPKSKNPGSRIFGFTDPSVTPKSVNPTKPRALINAQTSYVNGGVQDLGPLLGSPDTRYKFAHRT